MRILEKLFNFITLGEYFRYKEHKELIKIIDEYEEYMEAIHLDTRENMLDNSYFDILDHNLKYSDVGVGIGAIINNFERKVVYIQDNFQNVPFVKYKVREKKLNELL